MEEKFINDNYHPLQPTVSKLRFYSAGIVAENKKLTEKTIEVVPIEDLTMVDGKISSQITAYKSKGKDVKGGAYETSVNTTVSLVAHWLPISNSNRITAPDVRRGELVMIYQFGDTDKYYWTTIKEDLKLRKLETVIYAFSATRDENKDATYDTTYFFEVSTHKKIIHLHTSKDDKEPFVYDIQLNTKDGIFILCDDVGNHIYLNSKDKVIELHNSDDSIVRLDKKDILIKSIDSITLESRDIIRKSTTDTTTTTTYSVSASTIDEGGSSSISIHSPATSVN